MNNELALFPLNTVLFPGMPLGLHIFEERYKQMIGECIQTGRPFGVVLIEEGLEALGPLAEPHSVGCTAHITQVQRVGDGRMNIVAVGQERFRILSLNRDRPYLTGEIEVYPLPLGDQMALNSASQRLLPFIERYLSLLAQLSDVEANIEQLPEDPVALGYLAATLLSIPSKKKQTLLAAVDADRMLADIRLIYRQELPLLRLMLQHESKETEIPFSLN